MPQETVVYLAALDRAGRPDLALPLLEQLAGFYRSLKIADSQFLFGQGMPFFEVFLRNSLSIVRCATGIDRSTTRWMVRASRCSKRVGFRIERRRKVLFSGRGGVVRGATERERAFTSEEKLSLTSFRI